MGIATGARIVGRETELAELEAALAAAEAATPRLVIITGDSGIGKTRLVAEAAASARERGWRIMTGGCLDIGDGGLPYLPLGEALRVLVRDTPPDQLGPLLGPASVELAVILPDLSSGQHADARGPEAAGQWELSQARLFERFLQLLTRLSEDAPTALVIEDVHWIDRATRDLVTFLVRNLGRGRILIVLTCRTDGLARGHPILAWLAELGRAPAAVRLDLHPLPRDAVVRQLEAIGGIDPPALLVDQIWRRSEGNPMFVEELYAANAGSDPGAGLRPGTLVEILLARVAGLSATTRTILAPLAVAGRPVDDSLLAAVAGTTPDAVMAGLRAAIEGGVVSVDPASGHYRFRHELLREVVEGELLAGERRALHERFATVLSESPQLGDPTPAGAAAELAHHWLEAGRPVEAFAASLAAGDAAEAAYAHADAHRHFERAIALEARLASTAAADVPDRLALRRRAADAADFAGDLDRSVELTREALSLVDPEADPETAGILHGRLGYVLWASGHGTDAVRAHERAVELVPGDPPTAARARVLAGYAGALMGSARWADSRDAARRAAETAVAVAAEAEEVRARNVLGSVLVALGDGDGGVSELGRARELAQAGGSPDALIVAHHNLALVLLQGDRFEEALREAQGGLAVARRTGLERRFGMDLAALAGSILIRLGRWLEAEGITRDALAQDPAGRGTVYLATVIAHLVALRGDPEDALRRTDPFALDELDPDVAAELSFVRAEAALLAGDPDRAGQSVQGGLAAMAGLDDVLWTIPLLALGMRAAAARAGRGRAVRETSDATDAVATGSELGADLTAVADRAVTPTMRAWSVEARASAAQLDGRSDPAAWREAAAAWEAVPDRYRAAEARLHEAEAVLFGGGSRGGVLAALDAAHRTAVQLGAPILATGVETLAARARIDLPRIEVAPAGDASPVGAPGAAGAMDPGQSQADLGRRLGLSPREVEVLTLVAAGLSNGQIAARLFITRKTAAVHVTHILDKLGVGNRVEAAVIAERAGLRP